MSNGFNIQHVITTGFDAALVILDTAYGGREFNPFQKEAMHNKVMMQSNAIGAVGTGNLTGIAADFWASTGIAADSQTGGHSPFDRFQRVALAPFLEPFKGVSSVSLQGLR